MKINKNHVNSDDFVEIKERLFSSYFPYYFQKGVAGYDDGGSYFTHILINDDGEVVSEHIDILYKIIKNVKHSAIRTAIINLYPQTKKIQRNKYHFDLTDYENKPHDDLMVGVFYVNTNDGGTQFFGGDIVNSEENKLVLFSNTLLHRSSSCTNDLCRIVVNFNYYE